MHYIEFKVLKLIHLMKNTFGISIIPQNENERLKALQNLQILESDVQSVFDNIAHIMAETFDVPIALISLVDNKQVFFKGNAGMAGIESKSRGISLCSLAILNDGVTVFEDALKEKCLLHNPLVAGEFGLKFYAGAPLTTKEGYNIGTVCIIDKESRNFSEKKKQLLQRFATMAMHEIYLQIDANKATNKHAETVLKQNDDLLIREAYMSLAQQMAGMASWEWQLDKTEIEWSPEMYKFWGFEMNEISVTLDTVATMTHPEDLPILQKAIESVMSGQNVDIEYRRYDKLGNEIVILTKTLIKKDINGEPISVFGIDMNISDIRITQNNLKIQNQRLSEVNAELNSFNYIASHDLKEPLRKIQMFSDRIIQHENDNLSEKAKAYFDRILHVTNHMQQLIDSLLVFSKVSESSDFEFSPVDLNTVLANIEDIYSEHIIEKNAVITKSELPIILGLPEQVAQVFNNLINNALKFARHGEQPNIHVSAKKERNTTINNVNVDYWKIDITDNGIGFEPEYEQKIFEIFQRLHSKTEYDGTGIGLSICKKIMQKHDGYIQATSKLNEGSVFSLYFPIKKIEV